MEACFTGQGRKMDLGWVGPRTRGGVVSDRCFALGCGRMGVNVRGISEVRLDLVYALWGLMTFHVLADFIWQHARD